MYQTIMSLLSHLKNGIWFNRRVYEEKNVAADIDLRMLYAEKSSAQIAVIITARKHGTPMINTEKEGGYAIHGTNVNQIAKHRV